MEIEFIKVLNPWGESFGGNQSSFANYNRGRLIKKCGCGLIALCDTILSVKKQGAVQWNEYKDFVCEKARALSLLDIFGIRPKKIVKILNNTLPEYAFRFIPKRKLTAESLRKFFEKSIEAGVPVIVRIGENRKKLSYKMDGSERKMRWHYITVTGIKDDKLTFFSWGSKGEMLCSELYRFFGITGGIIINEKN